MVMVVADTVFEAGGRSRRLDAADQTLRHEQSERVVHRLQGDRANLRANDVGHGIGGDVRLRGYGSEHGQPLRCDLNTALTEKFGGL